MAIKIGQSDRINERRAVRSVPLAKSNKSFDQELADHREQLSERQLRALFAKVDEQAKRVAASRTIKDVQLYKKFVRRLLQEAVRIGLGTREVRSWQQGGARQMLVQTVDEKLLRLTEDFLDQNKDEIELLDRLDEIRGLLINLYI